MRGFSPNLTEDFDMADPNANMTKTKPQEVIISVIAGLFAPLIAIFLVVQLILGIQSKHVDTDSSAAANAAVEARIKPFATLVALDASAPKVEQTGEQVFNAVCTACHTPGALGAPKFKSVSDWAPRIKEGYQTLIKHALEGYNGKMPPRGGNPDLSDLEVERAVAYMADAAGAKFTPPEPAPAAAAPAAGAAPAAAGATPAAGAAAAPGPMTNASGKGEATFKQVCSVCHMAGVAGAPKFGDKAAWAPRIATGMDKLYNAALHGLNAMPAKGGNSALSDADVKAAVDYMVSKAK
jgi:cytochrome c5